MMSMSQLSTLRTAGIILFVFFTFACQSTESNPDGYFQKDLSEQMDAMATLQGSIGEDIKQGQHAEALWLAEGLDSVMQVLIRYQDKHPNLKKPFHIYYEKKMAEPIHAMIRAMKSNDTATVTQQYQLLVKRCNSCHNDHEVEERAHY